jgi:predicted DsbA family dithiol-disulfide isomerase
MLVSEGFCSVGLDDSVASDTLQEKAYQHNNKSELKEAKYKNTSVPTFFRNWYPMMPLL